MRYGERGAVVGRYGERGTVWVRWRGTVRYGTVRYGTVRYGTVWYGAVRESIARTLVLPWHPRVLRSCDMEYVMLHLIFSLPHAGTLPLLFE